MADLLHDQTARPLHHFYRLDPQDAAETAKESGRQHAQEVKESAEQSAQDVKENAQDR